MISSKFNSIFLKNNFFRKFLSTNHSEFKGANVNFITDRIDQIIKRQETDLASKDALSITSFESRWTYEELSYHISATGYGLSECNLDNQKRILSHLPNIIESLLLSFSAPLNRFTHIPTQYPSSSNQISNNLKLTEASGFVFGEYNEKTEGLDNLFPEASQNFSELQFKSSDYPALKKLIHTGLNTVNGAQSLHELLINDEFQELLFEAKYHRSNDDFILGSLNDNKLALFKQSNIVKSAQVLSNSCDFDSSDRIFIGSDFYLPSTVSLLLSSIITGSFSIITGKEFNADAVLKTCNEESATALIVDSDKLKAIAESSQLKESTLKKLIVVNNPKSVVSAETLRFVSEKLKLSSVFNGFTVPETNAPFLFKRVSNFNSLSLGSVVDSSHIRIADNNNKVVPVGSKGYLYVKGPQVMNTFANEKDNNNILDSNGWLNTRVTGYTDSEGNFNLA